MLPPRLLLPGSPSLSLAPPLAPIFSRALCTAVASLVAPGLQSVGSVVVVHGLSCSAAHGIFSDQESTLCLLPWQADSLPLSYQGSPAYTYFLRSAWLDYNSRTIEYS